MSENTSYNPQNMGALPLVAAVNAYVGDVAAFLAAPNYARFIVLMADKGGFRARAGNVPGAMPATEFPAAAVTNGSAGIYLAEGDSLVLPREGAGLTVVGYATDSVLTYYWF